MLTDEQKAALPFVGLEPLTDGFEPTWSPRPGATFPMGKVIGPLVQHQVWKIMVLIASNVRSTLWAHVRDNIRVRQQ